MKNKLKLPFKSQNAIENYLFPPSLSLSVFVYNFCHYYSVMLTSTNIVKRPEVIEGKKMKGNYIL